MAAAAAAAGAHKAILGRPPPVVSAVLSAAGQGSVLGGEEEEEGCLAPCGPAECACGSGDDQWQGGPQGGAVTHAPSGDPATAASGDPAAAATATGLVSTHLRMEVGSGRAMRWMVRLFVLVVMGTLAWTIYYVVVTHQVRATPNHPTTQPHLYHRTTLPPNHRTTLPPNHRTTAPPNHRTTAPLNQRTAQPPNCPTARPPHPPGDRPLPYLEPETLPLTLHPQHYRRGLHPDWPRRLLHPGLPSHRPGLAAPPGRTQDLLLRRLRQRHAREEQTRVCISRVTAN